MEKSRVGFKARILKKSCNSVSLFARKIFLPVFHLYVIKKDDPYEHAVDYFVEKS